MMKIFDVIEVYSREIMIGAGVLGCAAAGLWYYKTNRTYAERSAQDALAQVVAHLEQGYGKSDASDEVAQEALAGYRQYASTSSAPPFLVAAGSAFAAQQKLPQALEQFDKALSLMSTSNPYYGTVMVTRALVKIDSGDDALRQQGLKELVAVSQESSLYADRALYHLVSYYRAQKDDVQADFYQNQLTQKFGQPGEGLSPWLAALKG